MPIILQGTCEEFCPESEYKLRTTQNLLHYYELKNGAKNIPGTLVKEFTRSAAGVKTPKARDLRTVATLHRTIKYLLNDIYGDKRRPFFMVYDFIFDRMRAVRQEVVMQNLKPRDVIKLLQPMVIFIGYSRYRLSEDPICRFDPKICDIHLQECLKRLLCCYDEIPKGSMDPTEMKHREFIESIYQVFNIGSVDALRRGLTLPADIKDSPTFRLAFEIGLNYHRRKLYQVFQGIQKLPHILCAVASLKLQFLRRHMYRTFANAYSCQHLTVPSDFICRVLCYEDEAEMIADCKYFNVDVEEMELKKLRLKFQKAEFKFALAPPETHREPFVDEKLRKVNLHKIFLLERLQI